MGLFRKGQWVKGKLHPDAAKYVLGALMAGDWYVGIYHPAHQQRATVTVNNETPAVVNVPEHVTLVRPDRSDALLLVDQNIASISNGEPIHGVLPARIFISCFTQLEPLLDPAELPTKVLEDNPAFVLTT